MYKQVSVVLFLLGAVAVSVAEPDCTNVPPSEYIPDPDCRVFWQCVGGIAYRRTCPANLWFNPIKEICDYPEDSGCYPVPTRPTKSTRNPRPTPTEPTRPTRCTKSTRTSRTTIPTRYTTLSTSKPPTTTVTTRRPRTTASTLLPTTSKVTNATKTTTTTTATTTTTTTAATTTKTTAATTRRPRTTASTLPPTTSKVTNATKTTARTLPSTTSKVTKATKTTATATTRTTTTAATTSKTTTATTNTTTTRDPHDFSYLCEKDKIHRAPYPWDCSKYIQCIFGKAEVRSCCLGKLYSPDIQLCVHPWFTKCKASTTPPPTTPAPTTPAPTTPAPTTPAPTTPAVPTKSTVDPDDFSWVCKPLVRLAPYPYDCHKFIFCLLGHAIIKTCPLGLEFNPITKTCLFPHLAWCQATPRPGLW